MFKPGIAERFRRILFGMFLIGTAVFLLPGEQTRVYASETSQEGEELLLLAQYQDYQERLEGVENWNQAQEAGFRVDESQVFPLETECFGPVFLVPAIERTYNRLVLFLAREDGTVVYRTDRLEANNRIRGSLAQTVRSLAAVSFQELNRDGKIDIVLIANCMNESGSYAYHIYKTGDVLFQGEDGFYGDWRISDKINRFSMNKSVDCITAFVRKGYSTEFLYTASTRQELVAHGFKIAQEQCYFRQFEKLGRLEVVPGTYTMADFSTLMIYLINEQGDIVWSLQPMGDYDNLYALRGLSCKDIDGDGMKDILVLARYSYEGSGGTLEIQTDYSVFYQRTGGFYGDEKIRKWYLCDETTTVSELIPKLRSYWGWKEQEPLQE